MMVKDSDGDGGGDDHGEEEKKGEKKFTVMIVMKVILYYPKFRSCPVHLQMQMVSRQSVKPVCTSHHFSEVFPALCLK